MATDLKSYRKENPPRGFRPVPHYFADGDYLTYYLRDERCVALRVDRFLTVYTSLDSGELIGFKLKGVRHILKTFGRFGATVSDGDRINLSFLFSVSAIGSQDEVHLRWYDRVNSAAADKYIPRELVSDGSISA